jgi:MoaA/NifB/PqqE/SkfB family radical SAM enzyme
MKSLRIPEQYNYMAAFLTMRCQLNCSFCLNAFDNRFNRKGYEEISGKDWIKGFNRIEPRKGIPMTLSGGEPSLHPDFIEIINNTNPELDIDILTNLYWPDKKIDEFIDKVDPKRLKRDSPYASIRASYHPEQMDPEKLVKNAKKLQDSGFDVGIWSVLYPSPEQLSAINQMQFRCKDNGIDFRVKEFTGDYKGERYGDYSKYPGAIGTMPMTDSDGFEYIPAGNCICRTSELLLGPDARAYKCHSDLYGEEDSIGNLLDEDFSIEHKFRKCKKYGVCHPCDVKVKTNYKQELGHTSVDIKKV